VDLDAGFFVALVTANGEQGISFPAVSSGETESASEN
jgi:hypothetical protein